MNDVLMKFKKKKLKLKLNELGILEVFPKPSVSELNKFYKNYYQEQHSLYKKKYSKAELDFKINNAKIANFFLKKKIKNT